MNQGQQAIVRQPMDPINQFVNADWLSGWEYRKVHTIDGSPGAGTNYQIKLTVLYMFGIDSRSNVYCNSECQTNFNDIRFIYI